MKLYGLLITKDDRAIFGDWCRAQLPLYDAVVCLDGSESHETAALAAGYANRLIYLHERDFEIPHKTDHGLRRVVHEEIMRRFGVGHWVMCCHADEFCYHDPRKIAARAEAEGYDSVAWFSLHFLPHPDDLSDWERRRQWPVLERIRHYHWGYRGSEWPWLEERLYRADAGVAWDEHTHGSTAPRGLGRRAPWHPILRHYKVFTTEMGWYEREGSPLIPDPSPPRSEGRNHGRSTYFRSHWIGLQHRTGVPFAVERAEDLFVARYEGYDHCDRFEETFPQAWNMGEVYRPDGDHGNEASALKDWTPGETVERLHERACDHAVRGEIAQARLMYERLATRHAETTMNSCGRIAIVSFLFNWPSTGGGIVHTVELASFLGKAGFEVGHFYARYPAWGIGSVQQPVLFRSEALDFDGASWNVPAIQERYRQAVAAFDPDHVIITDSWNIKPLLAEAVRAYPYVLRFQAMECLCPLNNVRLLWDEGGFRQCPRHQLASPDACAACLRQRGRHSGSLHQAERALSGAGTPEYHQRLVRALKEAEAVLIVNPLHEAMLSPYCEHVRVVTAGMDPARFPWPPPAQIRRRPDGKTVLFFAGLVAEAIKGYAVLHEACARLWQRRQDFELVATGDPIGPVDAFTRFVGWQSQENLPRQLWDSDVLVMPTIAQEALGRTAVEAMAAGLPVLASRLGGLPFTVADGATGLLCEPGDPVDLAAKLEILLNDPALRERLGQAGRQRFEEHYDWNVIIDRHYRPLLNKRRARLSVIVSVLESYEIVRRQLVYLERILTPECELILVDDGSEPPLQAVCNQVPKTFAFTLHCTRDRRPWTQPRGRNCGARLARGPKLLFFDIDHILTADIVRRCLDYEGDKLHWYRRPGILDEQGQLVTDPKTLRAFGLKDGLANVHWNSFLIRKELFEALGGYDERFCGQYGGDDVDFNDRYTQLCAAGRAKPEEIAGEGYVFPDPAFVKELFHSLPRVPNGAPAPTAEVCRLR